MRRTALAIVCGLLLTTGCSKGPTTPSTGATTVGTETTQATDPTQTSPPIPAVDLSSAPTASQLHDPLYWNEVLAALNHAAGNVFRSVVSARRVEPDAAAALRQVYGPELFGNQHESLQSVAAGKAAGVVVPPGDPVATVTEIVKADSECVGLIASLDYSKVNTQVPTAPSMMELRRREATPASGVNPTVWIIENYFVITAPDNGELVCSG